MYNANDLAKAMIAVEYAVLRQLREHETEVRLGFGNDAMVWNMREIAKAALDAQYLPAQEPPTESSKACMIYRNLNHTPGLDLF